jgi:hypothetical protein
MDNDIFVNDIKTALNKIRRPSDIKTILFDIFINIVVQSPTLIKFIYIVLMSLVSLVVEYLKSVCNVTLHRP